MTEKEILNARIIKTHLGYEDHGMLTFVLELKFEGYHCGFGTYCLLGKSGNNLEDMKQNSFGMHLLKGVLNVVGVTNWEDLTGKYIRVETDGTTIQKIGHIVEDKWLDPALVASEWFPEKGKVGTGSTG